MAISQDIYQISQDTIQYIYQISPLIFRFVYLQSSLLASVICIPLIDCLHIRQCLTQLIFACCFWLISFFFPLNPFYIL